MLRINEQLNIKVPNLPTTTPKSLIKQSAGADTFVSQNKVSFCGGFRPEGSFFSRVMESIKRILNKPKPPTSGENLHTTQIVNKVLKCSPFDEIAYEKLLECVDKALIAAYRPTIRQATSDTISNAMLLKSYYDKIYGKGNYTLVSLGRSPELLTKTLEHTGVEAKYLPISGINTCLKYKEVEKQVHKAPKYLEYIKEQGLTKEQVGQSDKKFIFVDYTNNGTSLKHMKQLFEDYFKLPKEQIEFRSINNDLLETAGKQSRDAAQKAYDYINKYMMASVGETYTLTPELHYTELNSIYDKFEGEQFYNTSKIFHFHLKRTMQDMGLMSKTNA